MIINTGVDPHGAPFVKCRSCLAIGWARVEPRKTRDITFFADGSGPVVKSSEWHAMCAFCGEEEALQDTQPFDEHPDPERMWTRAGW